MNVNALDAALAGRLVVSCQPVTDGPLDDDDIVVRFALAALAGGAAGVRIEGAARVAHVAEVVTAPIVGIVKRDLVDSPVRITPFLNDVAALARAGATIIAVDATARPRPVPVAELLAAIREAGALAMADCSTLNEGIAAAALGFDIIGTTLAGYTGGPNERVPAGPDIDLVRALAARVPRVMAEGRYNTPQDAAKARAAGAWAVTVGSAITRVELVTRWFADQVAGAGEAAEGKSSPTSARVGSEANAP